MHRALPDKTWKYQGQSTIQKKQIQKKKQIEKLHQAD